MSSGVSAGVQLECVRVLMIHANKISNSEKKRSICIRSTSFFTIDLGTYNGSHEIDMTWSH